MNTTLITDGDILLYRAAAATERGIDWGDGIWTLHGDIDAAKRSIEESLEAKARIVKADRIVVALSDPSGWYFRHDLLPTYKGSRKDTRKPMLLGPLQKWVTEVYGTITWPTLEADDVMGILGSAFQRKGTRTVIDSEDKDLLTVPCSLMRKGKVQKVTEMQADYTHLMQALTGDTTDGYKGCPGVGPVSASRILVDVKEGEEWSAVVKAYDKAGLTEDDALVQARVARILRATDFNFETQEVILWNPE